MAPKQITERTLTSVLSQLNSSKGKKLINEEQIKKLESLTLEDGQPILSLSLEGRGLTFNLISSLEYFDFETLYNFLTSKKWKSRDTILLESPILEKTRQAVRNDNELYRNKSEIEKGLENCFKCGGSEVLIMQSQTRGADEPMTNHMSCITCGAKWKK